MFAVTFVSEPRATITLIASLTFLQIYFRRTMQRKCTATHLFTLFAAVSLLRSAFCDRTAGDTLSLESANSTSTYVTSGDSDSSAGQAEVIESRELTHHLVSDVTLTLRTISSTNDNLLSHARLHNHQQRRRQRRHNVKYLPTKSPKSFVRCGTKHNFSRWSGPSEDRSSWTSRERVWIAVFLPFPEAWLRETALEAKLSSPKKIDSIWGGLLAAQDFVNRHSAFFLGGRRLCLEVVDTPCNTGRGLQSLFEQMQRRPETLAVIGPNCYHVTTTIAQTLTWWHLVQVEFDVKEYELANRKVFPTLVRTVPSLQAQLVAMATLLTMSSFNWTVIDVTHSGDSHYLKNYNEMLDVAQRYGIEVVATCTLRSSNNESDLNNCVNEMSQNWNNIKVMFAYDVDARSFFCQIIRSGAFKRSRQKIWILIGDFGDRWWISDDVTCTSEEMLRVLDGHFLIDARATINSDIKRRPILETLKNVTKDERLGETASVTSYAYDTILSSALAMGIALNESTFDNATAWSAYEKSGNWSAYNQQFRERILQAFDKIEFDGLTGQLTFEHGERLGDISLRQLQGNRYVSVGRYVMSSTPGLTLNKTRIQWPDGIGPPPSTARTVYEMNSLSPYVFAFITMLSCIGTILALAFLAFNVKYRMFRVIKMSSPNLNNVIAAGCITAYVSLVLMGLESKFVSPAQVEALCKVRHWLPTCAFTLAFGTMFLKTWRVYSIFTNVTVKRKVIKDTQLFGYLGVFLSIDIIILAAWHVVDPIERVVKNATKEVWAEFENNLIVYQSEFCKSNHGLVWMAIIFTSKGVLLVFGSFLAWETRHVALASLNDSKYIGASVYVTVIACVIGVTTSFALRDYQNISYVVTSLSILSCTTATLCLVFVPKVTAWRHAKKNPDESMRTRLHMLNGRNRTTKPLLSALSMTLRNTPTLPTCIKSETVIDDRPSTSSPTLEPNGTSDHDVRVLRERLRVEKQRLEKILEEKTECRLSTIATLANSSCHAAQRSSNEITSRSALT